MIPPFDSDGNLPPGVHWATWDEIVGRFGTTAPRRRLLRGFSRGVRVLRGAGCRTVYLDGSFVTGKAIPGDFDACWDVTGVVGAILLHLDPVLLDFTDDRAAQKAKYFGEFFPAQGLEIDSGRLFLDFFQIDKRSGNPKGIVALDIGSVP